MLIPLLLIAAASIYPIYAQVAPFVDESKDPQSYVDRYNNEPSYKEWFDENYPEYDSIYEAVGLEKPESYLVKMLKNLEAQGIIEIGYPSEIKTESQSETNLTERYEQFNQLQTKSEKFTDEQIQMVIQLQRKSEKLTDEQIQMVIRGFEAYNKVNQFLLDECADVITYSDYAELRVITSSTNRLVGGEQNEIIGALKNELFDSGYTDHPELGPVLNHSDFLQSSVFWCYFDLLKFRQ